MTKRLGVIAAIGAAAVSMFTLGAGVASADDPHDPWDGKSYADAVANLSSYYTPVVAAVVGDQRAQDDCVVISSRRSHYRDRRGHRSKDYLFYLNCQNAVASGTPGNSAMSEAGRKAKEDQERARSLQQRLDKDPETCNKSQTSLDWCLRLCNRTGLCEVPT